MNVYFLTKDWGDSGLIQAAAITKDTGHNITSDVLSADLIVIGPDQHPKIHIISNPLEVLNFTNYSNWKYRQFWI